MKAVVQDKKGVEHLYHVDSAQSLYEQLVAEMKIDGLCGGCASCATCHVYLEPGVPVAPMSDNERIVIDGLTGARESSRLLCQLEITEAVESISLQLAEAE